MNIMDSKVIAREVERELQRLNPKLELKMVKADHEVAILLMNIDKMNIDLPTKWVVSEDKIKFNGIACNAIKKSFKKGVCDRIPILVYKNVAHLPEFQGIEDIK